MAIPRKQLISVTDTPYYHCISRCVRRAFLCGEDKFTGKSYEHRRAWVKDKIEFLSRVFALDISAYAIMSNHTHIVFFIDADKAQSWTDEEVVRRWLQLFKGTFIIQQYQRGDDIPDYLQETLLETIVQYRKRLMDISWFMRILNEGIARQANLEDNCTGRFWEGRFKSQALLDDAAVAACMAYVDLNPLRAGIAKTPETSSFTSIQQRITAAKTGEQPKKLQPFVGNPRKDSPSNGLQFELKDYLSLVDITGRCIREDKAGHIEANELPILERLNITPENWLSLTKDLTRLFHGAIGNPQTITDYYENHSKRRPNLNQSKKFFA